MPIVRSRKASTSAPCHRWSPSNTAWTRASRARRPARRAPRATPRSGAPRRGKDGIVGARLDEQRTGRDQRRDVEVLDRAELPGQHLRTAHVPRHGVGGRPRRRGSRDTTAAATRSSSAARNSAHVAAVREPGDRDPIGRDERVAGEQVERTMQVPQVARERHDAGHRRADQVPVAVVLVVGHPVGAFTEAAEVGREHDVTHRRELVARSRRPRRPRRRRTASPCPVRARGSRGPRIPAATRSCGTSRYAGIDMVGFGVEDERSRRYVPQSTDSVHLDVRRHRRRVGSEQVDSRARGARPPRLEPAPDRRRDTDPTRRRFEVQPPVRPVGEVARAGVKRPAPNRGHPRGGWRYAGVSHAAGKCPSAVENDAALAFGEAPRERIAERRAAARRLPSRSSSPSRHAQQAPAHRGAGRGTGTPRRASCHSAPRCAHGGMLGSHTSTVERSASTGGRRTARRRASRSRPSRSTSRWPSGSTAIASSPARTPSRIAARCSSAPRCLADREERRAPRAREHVRFAASRTSATRVACSPCSSAIWRRRRRPGRAPRARPRVRRDTARPG